LLTAQLGQDDPVALGAQFQGGRAIVDCDCIELTCLMTLRIDDVARLESDEGGQDVGERVAHDLLAEVALRLSAQVATRGERAEQQVEGAVE
jgi:hypothetical protein